MGMAWWVGMMRGSSFLHYSLLGLLLLHTFLLLLLLRPPASLSPPCTSSTTCTTPRIFVYDLPAKFNSDLLTNCSSISPWESVCPALDNAGLGQPFTDPRLPATLGHGSWFRTDQFTSEVIFHNRMLQHPCRTLDPALATAFYVPFYAGFDICRYLFVSSSAQQRDRLGMEVLEWLQLQPYWQRYGGWDHFLMIGRITWDFRRTRDEDWGSSFIYMQAMKNTTRLLVERNPWDDHEMGVPYPTAFHPQSDLDIERWQLHVRSRRRKHLFGFAGGPRKTIPNDFRAILVQQCGESAGSCRLLNCSARVCDHPPNFMELFLDSVFCLQPRGDSFTRRSAFDAILAGCIPVFFWNQSAYWQYNWHLPADDSSYSVFIPKDAVRNGVSIKQLLMALPPEKVAMMQTTIIDIIPKILYASPVHQLRRWKDALDIAIDGVVRRIQSLELHLKPQQTDSY